MGVVRTIFAFLRVCIASRSTIAAENPVWCLCSAEDVFADSSQKSSMQFAPQHLKPCTAIARAFARRVLIPMPLVADSAGREKRCTRHPFRLAGGWLGGFGLAWAPGTGSPCPNSLPTDGHVQLGNPARGVVG